MTKREFLEKLRQAMSGLPKDDVEERLNFYSEMIDDRIEEGLSEEDAVSKIGSPESVAAEVLSEIPLSKLVKEKAKSRGKLKTWEIVLLAVGSPVWFPLLIAAIAVALSLYVTIWAVLVSLWSVPVSLAACLPAGIIAGVILMAHGNAFAGIALLGIGFFAAGLAIFAFFGCKNLSKLVLLLTEKLALGIKSLFVRKEKNA